MFGLQESPRRKFTAGSRRKRAGVYISNVNRNNDGSGRQGFSSIARNIIAAESELLSFHHLAANLTEFLAGLKDSVQLQYTLTFFIISKRVRDAIVKLTILNLAFYNGINYAAPMTFQAISYLLEKPELDYDRYKGKVMHVAHLISILVTSIWYSYLTEHSYKLHGRKTVNQNLTLLSSLKNLSQEVYRFLIFGLILPQIHLVGFFPLGIYLKFLA